MKSNNLISWIFLLATLFLGVAFIAWTFIPYLQMRTYYRAADRVYSGDVLALQNDSFAFKPYTYVQPQLRKDLLTRLFQADIENRTAMIVPVLPLAIENMQEVIERKGNQPEYYLYLGRAYSLLAKVQDNSEENLAIAEKYYERALILRPNSQEIIYPYSINLSNQGKVAEAVSLLESIRLRDAETEYYLGIAQYRGGVSYYDAALTHLEKSLTDKVNKDEILTRSIYTKLFSYYSTRKDITRFTTVLNRLLVIDPENKEMYEKISQYIKINKKIPFIRIE